MRSLGQFARVEELQEMLQEIDVDGKCRVFIIKNNSNIPLALLSPYYYYGIH